MLSRFVLAVGSAVFDAMFNGGMATTSTEIELPDVEPAAFLALLKLVERMFLLESRTITNHCN